MLPHDMDADAADDQLPVAADEAAGAAESPSPDVADVDGAVAQAAADEAAAVTTEVSALARLYGEPLLKLPNDLYIPPDALEIFLDAFEGPLDLLLYLIR